MAVIAASSGFCCVGCAARWRRGEEGTGRGRREDERDEDEEEMVMGMVLVMLTRTFPPSPPLRAYKLRAVRRLPQR